MFKFEGKTTFINTVQSKYWTIKRSTILLKWSAIKIRFVESTFLESTKGKMWWKTKVGTVLQIERKLG